jgi:hypothetical protein
MGILAAYAHAHVPLIRQGVKVFCNYYRTSNTFRQVNLIIKL